MDTRILDGYGRPVQFSTYRPIETVLRKDRIYSGSNKGNLATDEALPQRDRYRVIAWLRQKFYSNSILASIVTHYATGIGYASPRVNTKDVNFNEMKETFLEGKADSIGWGNYDDMEAFFTRINIEEAICNEVFIVKMANGKLRLVAADMVGSPSEGKLPREIDGIQYGFQGQPIKYRIGKRDTDGKITFDNSTLINSEYVWHVGRGTRAGELRPFPMLASAIKDIDDLSTISDAKIEAIKTAAAYSLVIKKHTDPSVFAAIMQEGSPDYINDALRATYARSEIKQMGSILYGEVGEEVQNVQSSTDASDFDAFFFSMVGRISNCIGITPEEAIAGYYRSNYSSSRADKLRWKQTVDSKRRMHRHWLNQWQGWQVNRGRLDNEFTLDDPEGSTGRMIEWDWPHIPEIDEAKSATAKIALYQSGLGSKTEAAASRGRYIEEVNREQVNEAYSLAKMLKEKSGDNTEPTFNEIVACMPKGIDSANTMEKLGKVDNEE